MKNINKIISYLTKKQYVPTDEQKKLLGEFVDSYSPDSIIDAMENYIKKNKILKLNELLTKQNLDKYLDIKDTEIELPEYMNKLDREARHNVIECHNEILWKCCSMMNTIYEPILEKIFLLFTEHKVLLWTISGVLYHDIFKITPVPPVKVLAEMGKTDDFKKKCREQYVRQNNFKKSQSDDIKAMFDRSNKTQIKFGELNTDKNINQLRDDFMKGINK